MDFVLITWSLWWKLLILPKWTIGMCWLYRRKTCIHSFLLNVSIMQCLLIKSVSYTQGKKRHIMQPLNKMCYRNCIQQSTLANISMLQICTLSIQLQGKWLWRSNMKEEKKHSLSMAPFHFAWFLVHLWADIGFSPVLQLYELWEQHGMYFPCFRARKVARKVLSAL